MTTENQSETQTISNQSTANGQQIVIGITQQKETLPEPTVTTSTPLLSVLGRSLLSAWLSAVVVQSLSFLPWQTVTRERLIAGSVASALIVAGADAARRKVTKPGELAPSASYATSIIAGALLVI